MARASNCPKVRSSCAELSFICTLLSVHQGAALRDIAGCGGLPPQGGQMRSSVIPRCVLRLGTAHRQLRSGNVSLNNLCQMRARLIRWRDNLFQRFSRPVFRHATIAISWNRFCPDRVYLEGSYSVARRSAMQIKKGAIWWNSEMVPHGASGPAIYPRPCNGCPSGPPGTSSGTRRALWDDFSLKSPTSAKETFARTARTHGASRCVSLPCRSAEATIWEAAMSTLTRKDVTALFGELDD